MLTPPELSPAVHGKELFNARGSMLLFLVGISLVVLIGMLPRLRPVYETVV